MYISIKKLNEEASIPIRSHRDDACYDLSSCRQQTIKARSNDTIMVGLAIKVPKGYAGIIKGRSGMTKAGLIVPTGTVDSGYRGEVGVTVFNTTDKDITIAPHQRIAQFTLQKTYDLYFEEKDDLGDTDRGTNGFGSTGNF